jgi:hypothetical protein
LAYKAEPIPPDPICLHTYEEFASLADCEAGAAAVTDPAAQSLPDLVGEAKAEFKHKSCAVSGANSFKTMCNDGSYAPDKKMRYEYYEGVTDCAGTTTATMDIEVTATCQSGTKWDGSTPFFYKASPAHCFKTYVEYASAEDCDNAIPLTTKSKQTFPFLIGDANALNAYENSCTVDGTTSYKTTCSPVEDGT